MKRLALCLALAAGPLWAQSDAKTARQQLAHAAQRLQSATDARDQVKALTETVSAYEAGLAAMREGLRQTANREHALSTELDARSARISDLLGVLQTIGHAPQPVMLLHPDGPLGTARGGMLIAQVTPALQAEAEALKGQLAELDALRAQQAEAMATVRDGLEGAQAARVALSQAIDQRTDLPKRFEEDPVQTALLIASAETLDSFAKALAGVKHSSGDTPDLSAKGALPPPAPGALLRPFRNRDAAGVERNGVVLATAPQALVTLPLPATVLFTGPLLDYGTVTVLEPAPDVLILLAGLTTAYGKVGEIVPAASPIGLMGGDLANVDAFLSTNDDAPSENLTERLYIEVRENGTPVDPATWFAFSQ